MRTIRLGLISAAMIAAAATAGCGGDDPAGGSTPSGGGGPSGPAQATTGAAPATAASAGPDGGSAMSADAKAACTRIKGDIKGALAKVAEAEKIGPPAGHSAVSAQYSAGAAGLYVHTFTSSAAVNDAAKQVATAMTELADKYAANPRTKPSTAALDTAVKQVETVCAAG